jgi:CRP-like cAMP-binding protein
MDLRKTPVKKADKHAEFDVEAFLASAGLSRRVVRFPARAVIFSQGDPCEAVMYIQKGAVQLSVVSKAGKQAIVATLGAGDFFGESALTGQILRMGTATARVASEVLVIEKTAMKRVLHEEHAFSDRFIANMLARNLRIEADLVDQLFNSSEKRLARALLLLARYGKQEEPQHPLPRVSQESLAEMIGTTRSRVNFFMNKFKKLGFIEYNGGLKINPSLFSVVLHD